MQKRSPSSRLMPSQGISLVSCPDCDPSWPLGHSSQPNHWKCRVGNRSPGCCASAAQQQQLKHWCVVNTALVTSLNHSIIWAALKNIRSIPAKPSPAMYVTVSAVAQTVPPHTWPVLCRGGSTGTRNSRQVLPFALRCGQCHCVWGCAVTRPVSWPVFKKNVTLDCF